MELRVLMEKEGGTVDTTVKDDEFDPSDFDDDDEEDEDDEDDEEYLWELL